VDFGNEEIVSIDRLSECPDSLMNIPWQSVQIKLANIKLTDDERYLLFRDFETDRFEMKIIQKNQDIYLVDLFNNGKSIVEHILELRKKQQHEVLSTQPIQQSLTKVSTTTNESKDLDSHPISSPVQSIVDVPKQPTASNSNKLFQSMVTTANSTSDVVTKQLSVTEQKNDSAINDNLTILIAEQRRQNRLLEQVLAAINTTNALLTQLVTR
jgi:hypothetical protein